MRATSALTLPEYRPRDKHRSERLSGSWYAGKRAQHRQAFRASTRSARHPEARRRLAPRLDRLFQGEEISIAYRFRVGESANEGDNLAVSQGRGEGPARNGEITWMFCAGMPNTAAISSATLCTHCVLSQRIKRPLARQHPAPERPQLHFMRWIVTSTEPGVFSTSTPESIFPNLTSPLEYRKSLRKRAKFPHGL
jgi:hypothetical protein